MEHETGGRDRRNVSASCDVEPTDRPFRRRKVFWQPALTLAGAVMLTIGLVLLPIDASRFGAYSYGLLFLLTLLSSATIVLPSPALAAALIASRTLDPVAVGLVSGLAAGLGEATGYIAGRSGSELAHLRGRSIGLRIERYVRRWGLLSVFVLAAIPLPLIDLAGIAAGAMGLGFWRFEVACISGKTVRFLLVAFLGHTFL